MEKLNEGDRLVDSVLTTYESVLLRLPAPFYAAFYGELVAIYGLDIESNRTIDYITGTSGWNIALWAACKRVGLMDFYEWYDNLLWYESDEFDSVLSDELIKRIEKSESEVGHAYYLWLMNEKEKTNEELENN